MVSASRAHARAGREILLRTGLLRTRSDPAGGASAGKRLLHTLAVLMTN